MTSLLCPCGRMFEAHISPDDEIQIRCEVCAPLDAKRLERQERAS